MTRERWQRVDELFGAAVERRPANAPHSCDERVRRRRAMRRRSSRCSPPTPRPATSSTRPLSASRPRPERRPVPGEAPAGRPPPRTLRGDRAARRRRHGRGLSRPRSAPRREVAIKILPREAARPGPAAPLRARGARRRRAQPPQHPGGLRRRHARTACPTWSPSCSRARRCRRICAAGRSSRAPRWRSRARSPPASPPRTTRGSSTATSSRRTSSSPPTAG